MERTEETRVEIRGNKQMRLEERRDRGNEEKRGDK